MSRKMLAAKVAAVLVAVSCVLYFYGDYWLGILTARPDFQLSVDPNTIQLGYIGSSNTTVITVKSINGFDSNVTLDIKPVSGVSGVRFTLDPSEFRLSVNEEVKCALRIEATSFMVIGQYSIDVYGVSGNLTRSIRITIEVSY